MSVKEEYPEAEVLMGTVRQGSLMRLLQPVSWTCRWDMCVPVTKIMAEETGSRADCCPGQKVVVVEDLISTGGSAIEVVEALREAGAQVLGIVSIFTYGMEKGLVRMAEADVKNISLSDFDTIVQVAADTGYIKQEDVKRLLAFRNDPQDESWIRG